ncbi:MAG TPA: hypothetical protein VEC93_05865, partial [Anaerolineae bacterium]|nr:hypothetical protein [Anaerolineae bacterium]
MLFQHTWKHVVSGQKTQTRRLVQEGDYATIDEDSPARPITKVIRTADAGVPKVLFEVGKIYSVQPGIAKKTVGNIRLTAIRCERLHDLSDADALKESPVTPDGDMADAQTASKIFREIWNSMYAMPGDRWEDNPEVWVLEF